MKKNIFSKFSGFIMIETIVAVSIILMVVPVTVEMATKGITLSSYAKNQMIASYLAEEGIEYIRARRDSNLLRITNGESINWDDGFATPSLNCKNENKPCIVNPRALAFVDVIQGCSGCRIDTVPPSDGYRLYIDDTTGFYSPVVSGGTKSAFWRGISVKDISGSSDEHLITATVVWETSFGQKSISVSGYISNWLK